MEFDQSKSAKFKNLKYFIALHLIFFMNQFSGVFSKFAAREKFLSPKFCLFYAGIICILGIYALVWQQILKHISLTTAFYNKGIGLIWGMILGLVIFGEPIKPNMIIGALIVITGVVLVVKADE